MFCGVFDGHGPWGHIVAKRVRDQMPSSLLCYWQETVFATSLEQNIEWGLCNSTHQFDLWKQSYLKTCSAIDQDLEMHRGIESFYSGATALSIVRQVKAISINWTISSCLFLYSPI